MLPRYLRKMTREARRVTMLWPAKIKIMNIIKYLRYFSRGAAAELGRMFNERGLRAE